MLPSNAKYPIPGEVTMALVHHVDRGHDLNLCGLALVIVAVIAGSIPFLQFVVDKLFAIFE